MQILFERDKRSLQMFKSHTPKPQQFLENKATLPKHHQKLVQVQAAAKLLDTKKRQELVKSLPEILDLPADKYQQLCQPLLNHFAEMYQNLPETRNSYFAHSGGMIDYALERTLAALSLCRAYFVPADATTVPTEVGQLTEPQTLWMYALFSAAILHGVGKIVVDLLVELYDGNHKYLKRWSPFDGTMLVDAQYYDHDFEEHPDDGLRRRTTLLLARQLMPAAGFNWLASDKEVLAVWLALLDDDQRGAGTLGPVLIRAQALAVNKSFNEPRPSRDFISDADKKSPLTTMSFSIPPSSPSPFNERNHKATDANIAGVEFLKWVTKNLASQVLKLNQAPLFMVPGGLALLVCPEAFEMFTRTDARFKNAFSVRESLLKLGVHQAGVDNTAVHHFEQLHTQQHYSGIVLNNIHLVLPETFQIMSLISQQTHPMTPLQLANAQQLHMGLVPKAMEPNLLPQQLLAPDGTWQTHETVQHPARATLANGH